MEVTDKPDLTWDHPDLERLYLFARLLLPKLPPEKETITFAFHENIDLESYRVEKIHDGQIHLNGGQGELDPLSDLDNVRPDEVTRFNRSAPVCPAHQVPFGYNTKCGCGS